MSSPDLPTSREFVTQLLDSARAPPRASDDAMNAATANPLVNAPEPVKKQLLALHVLFPNELLPALDLLDRRLVTRFCIRRERDYKLTEAVPSTQNVAIFDSTTSSHVPGLNMDDAVVQSDDEGRARASKTSAFNAPLTCTAGQMGSPDAEMITRLPRSNEEGIAGGEESGDPTRHKTGKADINTIYYVRSAQQRSSRYGTSYDNTTFYEVRFKAWNCSCPAFAFSAFPSIHPEPPVPVYNPPNVDVTSYAAGLGETELDRWTFGGMSLGLGTPPACKHLLACVLVERCAAFFNAFVEERDVGVAEAAGWAAGWGD